MAKKKNERALLVNPRNVFSPEYLSFIIYGQTVLSVVSIIILVFLHYLLWEPNFFKVYGLMSLYTSMDLINLTIESCLNAAIYFRGKKYIEFDWCYPYLTVQIAVPLCLCFCSQWLKVAHAAQRMVIVYFPMTYTRYFDKRNIVILMCCVIMLALTIAGVHIWKLSIQKVTIPDKEELEFVDVCIFGHKRMKDRRLRGDTDVLATTVIALILSEVLPLFIMSVLCVMMIKKIRKQNLFRRQFLKSGEALDNTDKLLVILTLTTLFTVVSSVPRTVDYMISIATELGVTTADKRSIIQMIDRVLRNFSSFVIFILYGKLSGKVLQTLRQIFNWGKASSFGTN